MSGTNLVINMQAPYTQQKNGGQILVDNNDTKYEICNCSTGFPKNEENCENPNRLTKFSEM